MKVPTGQAKIARRFNGGLASPDKTSPAGTAENPFCLNAISSAPPGLDCFCLSYPRLKPRAIVFCLSEATLLGQPLSHIVKFN